ncbi:MAG: hypothetical protein ABFR89_02480 [Actinomycetota bacterium]
MAIIPTVDIVEHPQAHGYDGYIGNVLIRLAVTPQSKLEDITAEATPPRVDTNEMSEDVRDEVGRRYSRSNLSGGAGLDFLHSPTRPDDAALRYWDSKGVDVFGTDRGEIYDARLMHSMEGQSKGADITNVCHIDGTVYYLRQNVGVYDLTAQQVAGATMQELLAMGNSLYVRTTTGVDRYDPPSWSAQSVSTRTFDRIWAVKSRIVGVIDNNLWDCDSDSIILPLPTAETVVDVVDVGPAILVFATTGNVHALTLDQGLNLVTAGEQNFIDERPIMAAESNGVVGIATAETTEGGGAVCRFYTAELDLTGSFQLSKRQLVFQRGDRDTTDDLTPHSILATRDSIYLVIPEEGGTELTLWRYYTPRAGYARAHSIDPEAIRNINDLIEVDDRMWAAVDGDDLWRETDDYVVSGYIIGPLADFFTADDKQWVGGELSGVELPYGTSLELYDSADPALINDPDSLSWQLVTQLGATQSSALINTLTGRNSRYHAAKIIIRSDSSRTYSAAFRSYSFRALPNPRRDILLRIPINVSDQIESRGRRALTIPGRGKAIEQAIRAFEGQHVLLELYRPALQVRGLIEKFESSVQEIPMRGSVRRVLYATVRGSKLEDSEAIVIKTSGASLGQDILGQVVLGEGEVNE